MYIYIYIYMYVSMYINIYIYIYTYILCLILLIFTEHLKLLSIYISRRYFNCFNKDVFISILIQMIAIINTIM